MAGSSWTNQVVAKLVVGGPGGGVFIYNGTPAANNLMYSVSRTSGVDAFGNQYIQGAVSYSRQGIGVYAVQQDLNTAQIVFWTSTVAMNSTSPIWWQQAGNTGGVISVGTSGLTVNGGNNAAGRLTLSSAVSPILSVTPIAAQDPNNAGVPESWHTMTPSGSWANIAGESLEMRMMPDNMVALHGQLTIPTGVTGPANTVSVIGAAYRPPNRDEPMVAIETLSASPFTATAHLLLARSSGNLDLFGAATSGNLLRIQSQYPTDGTSN